MHKSYGLLLVALGIMLVAGGCEAGRSKKEATQHWEATRASIQASVATERYKLGNLDDARKAINDAIKLDPQKAAYRLLSARIYIERNQLESADAELTVARGSEPNNGEVEYLAGVIYQRWERPQLALEHYIQACAKTPGELAYLMARAEMLVQLDRLDEAVRLLEERVTYYEYSGALRDMLGELYLQQNKLPQAIESLHQAMILSPDEPAIREHLARTQFRAGKYRECLEQIDQLFRNPLIQKRADLLLIKGECHIQLEQWREARAALESSLEQNASSVAALLALGKVALKTNDLERADITARKAMALAPEDARVHLALGFVRLKQQQWDDALGAFQKAKTLDPKDPVALCLIGLTYEKSGQHDQAMTYYGLALQIKPDDPLASRLMNHAK